MKALFITFLLVVLPITSSVHKSVYISGGSDIITPGETFMLTVYPDNSSYTYEWSFDREIEKIENAFDISISKNVMTITAIAQTGIMEAYCTVYDENGNSLGTDGISILIH